MTPAEDFQAAKDAAASESALCAWRDSAFADLLTVAIGLAARQRPQELRRALSAVFEPLALNEQYERLETMLGVWGVEAGEVLDKLRQAQRRIEELEKRLEALEYDLPPAKGTPQPVRSQK